MERENVDWKTLAMLTLWLVVAMSVAGVGPAAGQEIAFGPGQAYPVGATASGVKSGDFDNDGFLDLLVASDGGDKLALFLGNGSGGFGAALETSLSASPTSLDVADLNSDGNLDAIIISRSAQQLITRLGQGDGTFGAPTTLMVASGAKEFTPLDFDVDGNVDVAYTTRNALYFVEGNGDGSFTHLSSGLSICGSCTGDEKNGLHAADLNDDGLPDIVAVDGTSTVHVTLNDGGSGSAPYPFPVTTQYNALTTPQDVGLLDLDSDGDLDVVVSGGASSTNWVTMYNDGTGALSNTTFGQTAFAWHLATADFDQDGALDVAFASDTDGITIARDAGTYLSSGGTFAAGTAAYDVAAADFNGDGYPDLAVADQSGNDLVVRLNAPTISWTGGGDGSSWSDPANWSPNQVPGPNSDVIIDYDPGSFYTITVSGAYEVGSITQTSSRATLRVDGQLTVDRAFDHAAGSVSGSGTLTVNGMYTLATGFGALSTEAAVLNGGLTWTDGDLAGTGTTTINGTSTVQAQGCGYDPPVVLRNDRRLELNATMAITSGCISPESGATFVVGAEGTVDFQAGETGIQPDGSNSTLPTLINNGTIIKTAGVGTFEGSTIGYQKAYFHPSVRDERLILQNNGTIRAEVGTLTIYVSEGSDTGGLYDMTGGRFTFYRANQYDPSGILAVTGTVQGNGTVQVYRELSFAGTLDLGGALVMRDGQAFAETLTITQLNELRVITNDFTDAVFAFNTTGTQTVQTLDVQGRMELNTDLSVGTSFTFGVNDSATLTGSGNITIPAGATMEWGDGSMGDSGTLTVEGTLTSVVAQYLGGDFPVQRSQATLNGRSLVVTGTVIWDDAPLYLNAGAAVDVQSGGTFDFQRDGSVEPGDGSTSEEQFANAGTVAKTGVGQRTSSGGDPVAYDDKSSGSPIAVPFLNSGTLSLTAGRTAFTDALDNTGRIQGTDTLDVSTVGAFTNTGMLVPGTSPGILTVEGPVDVAGTTLDVEVGGTNPGAEHDQLKGTDAVQLGGTLNVTLLDGYDPPEGTSFTIVEAPSVSGTFDTVNLPTLSGRTMSIEYGASSVTLNVTGDNAPPTAVDDAAQTPEDTAVIIDVLANDSDPDGDALSITDVTTPSNGTAEVVDNTVRYTPSGGYTGSDTFTYTIGDGNGGADEGTVTVTVQGAAGALSGTVTEASSGSPIAGASIVIAALDRGSTTDSEGAYTLADLPEGTYSVEASATGYQTGTQEVTITAGQTTTADFALEAEPSSSNSPPTAADDAVTTFRNEPVIINVLANDTDDDGDPLTITDVGDPTLGTVAIGDAALQYTPNDGATGTDAFNYVVDDGNGGSDEGTVTVTITAAGFTVTDVGTLGGSTSKAVAIDGAGRIIGVSTTESGAARAFIWDDGTLQPLPTPDADAIQVTAANQAGDVVGAALRDSTSEAFLIPADGVATALGTLGGRFSAAYAINQTGDVVGTAATASQAHHAFRWDGAMTDLGAFGAVHSEAFGINDEGTVVGIVAEDDGTTRPFVGSTVLTEASSGRAYAINAAGQIVGSQLDGDRVVARTWTSDGTGTTLEGLDGDFAEAYAINDAGWVVGTAAVGTGASASASKAAMEARLRQWRADPRASWEQGTMAGTGDAAKLVGDDGWYHAMLWIDGEPHDLNDFILDPNNEWTLIEARYVSDEGQIVGYGRYQGALRAFVLTPSDNAPPQARDDVHRVTASTSTVLDVLANDVDDEGQALRVAQLLDRPSGTVRLTKDSTAITYIPAPGFRGDDRFRYLVSDGAGGIARASVQVEVDVAPSARLRLHANYPNPFRVRTVVRYELPETAWAQLALYDLLGRRVITLVDEEQRSGSHEVTVDAAGLASGIYFLRLKVAGTAETRRLTVVR